MDGTTVGNPGWDMEDGQVKRRTEDEDNTLGMTQKVSKALKHNNNGETQEVSPMVSERDWTRKCSGAGAYEGWSDDEGDEVQVRFIGAQVKSGAGE